MLYLGIFLLILLLILFFPVNTTLKLHIDNRALDFNAKIYLFKKIRIYKKLIVIQDIFKFKNKDEEKKQEVNKKEQRKKIKKKNAAFLDKLNIFINLYSSNKERFIKLKLYIQRKFELKKTEISISEGTGDAAQTAMLYGVLWSLIGSINAMLSNFLTITFKSININCDYNNKTFKADINCIFSFSIANIIIVFLRLNYIMKKYELNVKKL